MITEMLYNNREVGVPCLREQEKSSATSLISPRSCGIAVPSDREIQITESASVFVYTLVHYNNYLLCSWLASIETSC